MNGEYKIDIRFLKLLIIKFILDQEEQKEHFRFKRTSYMESRKISSLEDKFMFLKNDNETTILDKTQDEENGKRKNE
jgi:hypothetical protein